MVYLFVFAGFYFAVFPLGALDLLFKCSFWKLMWQKFYISNVLRNPGLALRLYVQHPLSYEACWAARKPRFWPGPGKRQLWSYGSVLIPRLSKNAPTAPCV